MLLNEAAIKKLSCKFENTVQWHLIGWTLFISPAPWPHTKSKYDKKVENNMADECPAKYKSNMFYEVFIKIKNNPHVR